MTTPLVLHGYRYNVYTRAVRLALHHAGCAYSHVETDPFASSEGSGQTLHPFRRVPVLDDGGFRLYETAAINRYIAAQYCPALVPDTAHAAARMHQVIGIVDAYGYWPLVREVFSHGYWRDHEGETSDPAILSRGLDRAPAILDALEDIAVDGLVLNGSVTLAECHLGPMIAAFAHVPEAVAQLRARPTLAKWWDGFATDRAMRATDPGYGT